MSVPGDSIRLLLYHSAVSYFIMSQDPLVYMPLERWNEVQDAFKQDWPRCISGYTAIETQKCYIENGYDYGFKVFCPYGDVKNGMVAINEKDRFYELIMICPQDDTTKLEQALRTTQILNWNTRVIVPFAPYNVIECLQKAVGDKLDIEILPTETFLLDKPIIYEDVNLPSNMSFGLLSLEHAELVDSLWPHRYPGSSRYFETLINNKFGFGLFEGKNLIVWVFFSESGTLLHLCTVETHRRKGYAELLMKLVCNKFVKEGKHLHGFVLLDNVSSCKLFTKIGFSKVKSVAWCYLNKKGKHYVLIYLQFRILFSILHIGTSIHFASDQSNSVNASCMPIDKIDKK